MLNLGNLMQVISVVVTVLALVISITVFTKLEGADCDKKLNWNAVKDDVVLKNGSIALVVLSALAILYNMWLTKCSLRNLMSVYCLTMLSPLILGIMLCAMYGDSSAVNDDMKRAVLAFGVIIVIKFVVNVAVTYKLYDMKKLNMVLPGSPRRKR